MQILDWNTMASQQASVTSTHYIDPKVKKAFEIFRGVIFLRHSHEHNLTQPKRISHLLKAHVYEELEVSDFAKIAMKITTLGLSNYQEKQAKKKNLQKSCLEDVKKTFSDVAKRLETHLKAKEAGTLVFDEKLEGINQELKDIDTQIKTDKNIFLINKKIVICKTIGFILSVMKDFRDDSTTRTILSNSERLIPLLRDIYLEQFFPSPETNV